MSIQQDHVVVSKGMQPSPCRTGGELTLALRTDDFLSFVAKGDGVIAEKSAKHVVIKYNDPELGEDRVELGKRFGVVTGHVVPHDLACDFEVNQKVTAGTVVVLNTGFYERDWRDPRYALWKRGYLAWVMFAENNNTFEDASYISDRLRPQLVSPTGGTHVLMLNFNQVVHNLVNVGDEVGINDVLCYIEEDLVSETTLFNTDTLDGLKRLARNAPKSKYIGKIEKIEVTYFGDKEDMSPSLQKVATKYDTLRAKLSKDLGGEDAKTGQIFAPARIEGNQLEIDMMAIHIFISSETGVGGGDKVVLGNQMKSVISGVMVGECRTVGPVYKNHAPVDIDVQFSYRSESARIIKSPEHEGMATMLLENIGLSMADVFFGKK